MLPSHWDPWQYLLLMGGCLLITLPLEFFLRARVWSRPRRLLAALLPVVIGYSVWDIVGIKRDHWSYSPRFTTGWEVPFTPMPVEELVFFIVIPICGLLTYGAVGTCLNMHAAFRARHSDKAANSDHGQPHA